jgi:hypothetical protein
VPILHASSESSNRTARSKTPEVRNRKQHEPLPQPQNNYLTRLRAGFALKMQKCLLKVKTF